MPRNKNGKPVEIESVGKDIDEKFNEHHNRLTVLEKKAGVAHKPDDMKSEDQERAKKPDAGHVTEKKGASYGRKRH